MAFIDYGAVLKVNGKFINKDSEDFFMQESDTGYKPTDKHIEGFVLAGDKNFLLTFYKGVCNVYHNEERLKCIFCNPFIRETFYFDGFSNVTVERLDKKAHLVKDDVRSWKDWVNIFLFYADDLTEEELEKAKKRYPKCYLKYLRYLKAAGKFSKADKEFEPRWKASWEYNGNSYEVIYGYGIDNCEEVWNEIKGEHYDFTETERQIIDEWFKEAK